MQRHYLNLLRLRVCHILFQGVLLLHANHLGLLILPPSCTYPSFLCSTALVGTQGWLCPAICFTPVFYRLLEITPTSPQGQGEPKGSGSVTDTAQFLTREKRTFQTLCPAAVYFRPQRENFAGIKAWGE